MSAGTDADRDFLDEYARVSSEIVRLEMFLATCPHSLSLLRDEAMAALRPLRSRFSELQTVAVARAAGRTT